MQTIETRYFGPTNHRGARMKATSSSGKSVMMMIDPEWDNDTRHVEACYALMTKLNWTGKMIAGDTKRGMVWVFTRYALGVERHLPTCLYAKK